MRHSATTRRVHACAIELLEPRIAPANITATVTGHHLTIVGNDGNNDLTISCDLADSTEFRLFSGTDTIINKPAGVNPTGITDITIKMLGGDDSVTFDLNSFPNPGTGVFIMGSLTIDGGSGANMVTATKLSVGKNFTITNGTATAGKFHDNELSDLTVGGSLTTNDGQGDTVTNISRDAAGLSRIVGNLSITNGAGKDLTHVNDTSIGHNVTVKNGHGNAGGVAGVTQFYNGYNTFNTVIGGNLSVTYVDGDVDATLTRDLIQDLTVLGNVTIDHGKGSFVTDFDGDGTKLPVMIRGSLTMKGTGSNTIEVGTQLNKTGLIVGKNLTIANGTSHAGLHWNKLEVGGATKLTLGGGNDITIANSSFTGAFATTFGANGSNLFIDDTLFAGTFTDTLGSGGMTILLDTATGSALPTIFEKAVLIKPGSGALTVNLDGTADAGQELFIDSTLIIKKGRGVFTFTPGGHEIFPLGGSFVTPH